RPTSRRGLAKSLSATAVSFLCSARGRASNTCLPATSTRIIPRPRRFLLSARMTNTATGSIPTTTRASTVFYKHHLRSGPRAPTCRRRRSEERMTEQEHVGELVDTVPVDPLCAAFARALGVIMEALPPSHARDIAVQQIIGAHQRTEELLSRYRILN